MQFVTTNDIISRYSRASDRVSEIEYHGLRPGRKLREERTRPLSFHFFERHVPGVVNIQCIRSTIGYKSYPLLYFSPAIPQRQLNNFLKRRTPSDVGGRRNLWRVRQHPDRWCTARGSRSRILPPLHPSFIISRLLYPVFRLFRDAPWNIGSTLPDRLHVSFSKWIFINPLYDYYSNTKDMIIN